MIKSRFDTVWLKCLMKHKLNEISSEQPVNCDVLLSSTAGVSHPGPVRDGAGGGREEQEDFCGCDQHQTGGGAARQGDLVSPRQLCHLSSQRAALPACCQQRASPH